MITPQESNTFSEHDQGPEHLPSSTSAPVTPRAFGIGLCLALLICAVLPYNDYFVGATFLSGNFFPIAALGAILAIVLVVNPLLITFGRRQAIFKPSEILTVWVLIAVVAGIPSSGLMRYLIPHIIGPAYYSNATNGWGSTITSHLPDRLFVKDPTAARLFFEGLKRGQHIPWQAWAQPLFWWGLFVTFLFTAFFCMSALLRRQWVENERFTFPLVKLPVLLAEEPEAGQRFNTLLRSRLLWIGVILVTMLHTVKGLHLFYPTIPDIPTAIHSYSYLTTKPWNGLNDVVLSVFPLVIGFSYLLSSEVCFSMWFFYLLFKVQCLYGSEHAWNMAGTGTGWSTGPAFVSYQEAGGAVMLCGWLLFAMRPHLKTIWRKAIHNDPSVDDVREPLSFRFAFFGLLGAYFAMFCWLTLAAQMQPVMAVGVLLGSFVIFLMLSWIVAQAGLLFMQQAYAPSQLTTLFVGNNVFDTNTLAVSSITEHVGWQDAREFMMPTLLNAFKGAAETNLSARSLMRAMAVSVFLAVIVSAISSIWLPYTHGGGTALKDTWTYIDAPQLSLSWVASQRNNLHGIDGSSLLHMGLGAVVVLLLFLCRTYIASFALHPAGFLVAATYPMYNLWFSLMLGWICKVPIMRYGGMKGYRFALPFFMGLILGDCANALVWAVVGFVTKTGYRLMPG